MIGSLLLLKPALLVGVARPQFGDGGVLCILCSLWSSQVTQFFIEKLVPVGHQDSLA